jgi:NO-binding membrane sensor protein with MHYT domain
METSIAAKWQVGYVIVSYVISAVGGTLAFNAASRIRDGGESGRLGNTVAAAIALGGIGVWATHFVGMLALRLDLASSYSLPETAASLLVAILASALALGWVAKAPQRLGRVAGGGLLLAAGIVVMHYLGMYGMKFGGYIRWEYALVAASVAIALAAAAAALWLAFNTRSFHMRGVAGLLMAAAVCAMHYTGMRAAEFICTTADRTVAPEGFGYVSSAALPNTAIFCAMLMAVMVAAYQLYDASRGEFEAYRGTPPASEL